MEERMIAYAVEPQREGCPPRDGGRGRATGIGMVKQGHWIRANTDTHNTHTHNTLSELGEFPFRCHNRRPSLWLSHRRT